MDNQVANMCVKLRKMVGFGFSFKKQVFCVHGILKG